MAFKKLDLEEVTKQINQNIQNNQLRYDMTIKLVEGLKCFEGKKINKRVGDKAAEILPDCYVSYYKEEYKSELYISGHDGSIRFTLDRPSQGNGYYSHEKVLKYNEGYLCLKEENEEIENKKHFLKDTIEIWNTSIDVLKKVQDSMVKKQNGEDILYQMKSIFDLPYM